MSLLVLSLSLVLGTALGAAPAPDAVGYPSNKELGERVKRLAKAHSDLVRAVVLAEVEGERIWLVECGKGKAQQRSEQPAMLAVGGIEGNDLAGSAVLLAWVERLAREYEEDRPAQRASPTSAGTPEVRNQLDTTTLYVIPRLNPAAAERYFESPRDETAVNRTQVDDDHDGLLDEDGPEDLDGDGLITWMRVQDKAGDYVLDPQEPRLLFKADRAKGETGGWKLFREGRDNDKDESWNEDERGGVNLNRNFPYGFRPFAPDSGAQPVCEAASRALADLVVDHPNIGLVFTFGAGDNLTQIPKGEAPKRPPTGTHEDDVPFYRELGKAWREALGLKAEVSAASLPGTFADWMYFHRGRLSLAARAWGPAVQVALVKEAEKKPDEKRPGEEAGDKKKETPEKPERGQKKEDADKRNEEDRAFLKWLERQSPESFVAWKRFEHPDFPGKTVEIGGFAPFAKSNPPRGLLDELARKEVDFLTSLAGKLPRLRVRDIEVKDLGNRVFDVTVQVENAGYLPTALAQGTLSREVFPTRVVLGAEPNRILSGTKRTMLGPIEGSGGMKEIRYILNVGSERKFDLELVSALAGSVRTNITFPSRN